MRGRCPQLDNAVEPLPQQQRRVGRQRRVCVRRSCVNRFDHRVRHRQCEGRLLAGDDLQRLPPAIGLSLESNRLIGFNDVASGTQPHVGDAVDTGQDPARLLGLRLVADEERVASERSQLSACIGQAGSDVEHNKGLTRDPYRGDQRQDDEDEHAAHVSDPTPGAPPFRACYRLPNENDDGWTVPGLLRVGCNRQCPACVSM